MFKITQSFNRFHEGRLLWGQTIALTRSFLQQVTHAGTGTLPTLREWGEWGDRSKRVPGRHPHCHQLWCIAWSIAGSVPAALCWAEEQWTLGLQRYHCCCCSWGRCNRMDQSRLAVGLWLIQKWLTSLLDRMSS